MDENTIELIKISGSVLGGGLAGAFLNRYFDWRKNSKPKVQFELNYKSIFSTSEKGELISGVVVEMEDKEYKFQSLGYITLEINNRGHKDYSQFQFGLTLPEGSSIIGTNYQSSDRHHAASFEPSATFDQGTNKLDLKVIPFNRGDKYSFSFLTKNDVGEVVLEDIKLSSPEAADLRRISSELDIEVITLLKEHPLFAPSRLLIALFFPSISRASGKEGA